MELLTIKMLNTALERIMNKEMSELGLTYTQTTVIAYLLENPDKDVCQRDIEYSLGLTHPTVSSVLGRMEANGLIETRAMTTDHRYKIIVPTEKAHSLSPEVSLRYRKVKERLFSGIAPEEREAISAAMRTLLKNIQ